MRTVCRVVLLLSVSFIPAPGAARAQDAAPADGKTARAKSQADLILTDLFPRKGFFGKTARAMAWSHDDRYLAYLWNPYDDKGADLWLWDTKDKKAKRLTSIDLFTAYDRELPDIIERYKKDKTEDERRKTLSIEERRKLEDEDIRKDRDRKEPLKQYPGVSEYTWANKSDELIVVYKGDLYRMKVTDAAPARLTKTQEAESGPKYSKDDSGFYYRRGAGLFRMSFAGPVVTQLNPELPNNMPMDSYRLSPDGTKLLIHASRSTAPERVVTYISYRDRFAQAKTTPRDVADDPFKDESFLYVCDLNDDPKANPKSDGKPWEAYKWPAGEDLTGLSLNEEPWSPDSKKFVFSSFKRDEHEVQVLVADLETKKVTALYKTTMSGEHTTPGMVQPFYTPDGTKIVALLEAGYRHTWVLDPLTQNATQLTRGDFEVFPMKVSEDGKSLFVHATKEIPSRTDIYRVDMANGEMTRLTKRDGNYRSPVLSHDYKHIAATFVSWKDPAELYVLDTKEKSRDDVLTASHAGTFNAVNKLSPELFSYKNRLGLTIHGFLFRPPGWKKTDKRPLLIYVYGGPLGTGKQVEDGAIGGDSYLFNMWLAWKYGFVTCTIDPRGSSGYGGLFGAANFDNPGNAQVEDLVDGVKYLTENLGVDPKHVAVSGWSFGGFQTQMCMYTAPETFTLGIAGAGPTEWQNYNNWYSGGVIGKSRPNKPEDLDKFSLTHLAKNLKSPLMLLHGMEDTNVLFQDTVKVYGELLKEGKGPLVELVVDPLGSHGLGGDIRGRDRMLIYEAFIKRRWPEVFAPAKAEGK